MVARGPYGAAIDGGVEFRHLSQWLDNPGVSPSACFSRKLSRLPLSNSEEERGLNYPPLKEAVPAYSYLQ